MKRWRRPASVARLIAGIKTCRTGTVVMATAAMTAANAGLLCHHSKAAAAEVAMTNA